jgi:formylglycine-generating enzyme required for sulfatase activity
MADAVRIFGFLFLGTATPSCSDAADANDSGQIDISDGVYVLSFLFTGGREPPAPYPEAGPDPTGDGLDCQAPPPPQTIVDSIGMKLVLVPPGSFLMGSPEDEQDRWYNEGPVHGVHLSKGFYLGSTEVTQGQYQAVMGANPSFFNGGRFGVDSSRPVEQVSWSAAAAFCRKLSDLEGKTYRLPTEAEWEYACRAGTSTRLSFGDAPLCGARCSSCAGADEHLWWCGNSTLDGPTQAVGQKAPNPWGFFDMHGSVLEWCQDWYELYSADEVVDPQGPGTGEEKVLRGGSWALGINQCRSAQRFDQSLEHDWNSMGFRVAMEVPSASE